MSAAPADIRIDDLAHPRMPEGFGDYVKSLAPVAEALVFEPAAILDAACRKTGLDDFGPTGWERGLEAALRGLREGPALSPLGRITAHGALQQFLENRLRLEALIKRHPEILALELEPPIVIAGLPRSGTTPSAQPLRRRSAPAASAVVGGARAGARRCGEAGGRRSRSALDAGPGGHRRT
jgi:hypothetical protein